MGDIQELCSRLIIINKGQLIEDGPLDELIDRIAPYRRLIVDFYKEEDITHPIAEIVSKEGPQITFQFNKAQLTAAKLIEDISRLTKIKDVSLEDAKTDDIIKIAYNG